MKVKTDSQLLARQLNKVYKVRNANIIGLYNQVVHLLSAFKEVSINNIPRQENLGADKLATQAIKKELRKHVLLKKGQVECGCPTGCGEESPGSGG